jgi:hypothetical protein
MGTEPTISIIANKVNVAVTSALRSIFIFPVLAKVVFGICCLRRNKDGKFLCREVGKSGKFLTEGKYYSPFPSFPARTVPPTKKTAANYGRGAVFR